MKGARTIKSPSFSPFLPSVSLSIALLAKGQKMSSPSVVAREESKREKGTCRVEPRERPAEERNICPSEHVRPYFTWLTEFSRLQSIGLSWGWEKISPRSSSVLG